MFKNIIQSEGCTMFPDGNWYKCCVGHDYEYADGGTLKDKIKADFKLGKCVYKRGHPVVAVIMFLGLSIFGYFRFRFI